jgi:phosphate transport system protein
MAQQSEHIDQKIKNLEELIIRMAGLAEEAVQKSISALMNNDKELAQKVMVNDQNINEMELEIENQGVTFIALYQPEAIDLRTVISILRMVNDIERIGDLAVNIARASLELDCKEDFTVLMDLPYLSHMVLGMYHDSLKAFTQQDLNLATETIKKDQEVNALCRQIFREMLVQTMQNPHKTSSYVQYLLISRHLERIGDHCKNIAEVSFFLCEGRNIKHQCRDRLDSL